MLRILPARVLSHGGVVAEFPVGTGEHDSEQLGNVLKTQQIPWQWDMEFKFRSLCWITHIGQTDAGCPLRGVFGEANTMPQHH